MKLSTKILAVVALLGLYLIGLAPSALATGVNLPYTVAADGIQLPQGTTFADNGHVNIRTNLGSKGVHFEGKCVTKSDAECAGERHIVAQYIGKEFIPYSAFGLDKSLVCVSWVQVWMYKEHFGEGGEKPVGYGCEVAPTPTPTPETTPTPEVTPTPTPTPEVTPAPVPNPTETPTAPESPTAPPTATPEVPVTPEEPVTPEPPIVVVPEVPTEPTEPVIPVEPPTVNVPVVPPVTVDIPNPPSLVTTTPVPSDSPDEPVTTLAETGGTSDALKVGLSIGILALIAWLIIALIRAPYRKDDA